MPPIPRRSFKTYVCSQIPARCSLAATSTSTSRATRVRSPHVVINSQIDSNNNFINNMQYNPGGPGDVVVVRLFYQWPLFVTGLGYNISNLCRQQAFAGSHGGISKRAVPGRAMKTMSNMWLRARRSVDGLLQGLQRRRGDRIRHDRSADAGDVLRHGRVFIRRRGRSQGDAGRAHAVRSDVAVASSVSDYRSAAISSPPAPRS